MTEGAEKLRVPKRTEVDLNKHPRDGERMAGGDGSVASVGKTGRQDLNGS